MSLLYNFTLNQGTSFVFMKKKNQLHSAILLMIVSLLPACASQKHLTDTTITPFDNLIGHWEGPLGGGTFIEKWEKKSGDYLQGEAYWIRGGDTILTEDISIRKLGIHWAYIAIINHSAPTLFTASTIQDNKWIFKNPEHDYPQEVGYQLGSENELQAWTDGISKGKPRKDEYLLQRVTSGQ